MAIEADAEDLIDSVPAHMEASTGSDSRDAQGRESPAVDSCGLDLFTFNNTREYIPFFEEHLRTVVLISLDHDLSGHGNRSPSPGWGTDIADYLAVRAPLCPVMIHTSDYGGRWMMHDRLKLAGWTVRVVEPRGPATLWIPEVWIVEAKVMLENMQFHG